MKDNGLSLLGKEFPFLSHLYYFLGRPSRSARLHYYPSTLSTSNSLSLLRRLRYSSGTSCSPFPIVPHTYFPKEDRLSSLVSSCTKSSPPKYRTSQGRVNTRTETAHLYLNKNTFVLSSKYPFTLSQVVRVRSILGRLLFSLGRSHFRYTVGVPLYRSP